MKPIKYISTISLIIASVVIILKSFIDYRTFKLITDLQTTTKGDFSPSLFAGSIKIAVIVFALPILISLILSIIGFKYKNNYRLLALGLNVFAIVYIVVPIGLMIALVR